MRKAIILVFIVFLLLIPISFAQTTNYEIAENYTYDATSETRPCRSSLWCGQTFTIGNQNTNKNYNISKIEVNLTNSSGANNNLAFCIYSTTGGSPKTALSCNHTAYLVPMTSVSTAFNISIPIIELNASGVYAIVGNSTSEGGGTIYQIENDVTSPNYGGGLQVQSGDSGASWTQVSTRDVMFKVWGQVTTTGQDTTPPSITYYNLTNENGCESWNTDKDTACSTSSVTPTIQFNTSEDAFCAIAGSSSSTSFNVNYTQMESSRNCTGDMSGEGGTLNHRCTLTNQDELVYDTSYLFISCKDGSGNMNRSGTSTSGALKLSITGLEAAGRNSIGLGIQNALLSGYINYTDLQIYARNLSNAQVKGTFDRAAKKGSKMWAFNSIGVSDSHVNMFNLTPVLYTLELANKTSANITLQVEQLINATK